MFNLFLTLIFMLPLFLFEVREKKKEEILPLAFGDGGEVDRRRPRTAEGGGA